MYVVFSAGSALCKCGMLTWSVSGIHILGQIYWDAQAYAQTYQYQQAQIVKVQVQCLIKQVELPEDVKGSDCFEIKGKIILFYTGFLKALWEDMEVIHSFPNISMQQVNQRHKRWIHVYNTAIPNQPRDNVSYSVSTHR